MKRGGFTLVEIMIVVSIIGVLCMISIPAFIQSRNNARAKSCINNLRVIDNAIDMAALEYGWEYGDEIGDSDIAILGQYAKGGTSRVYCPADGDYFVRIVGSNPSCNIAGHILGLDFGTEEEEAEAALAAGEGEPEVVGEGAEGGEGGEDAADSSDS